MEYLFSSLTVLSAFVVLSLLLSRAVFSMYLSLSCFSVLISFSCLPLRCLFLCLVSLCRYSRPSFCVLSSVYLSVSLFSLSLLCCLTLSASPLPSLFCHSALFLPLALSFSWNIVDHIAYVSFTDLCFLNVFPIAASDGLRHM